MQPSPLAGSAPGTKFGGKYKIVRRLGEGGMGAVYEAHNEWTHRRVALKVLRPQYTSDADAVGRFMQEARSAAAIVHPNIVDVLDMGQEASDGSLYIVQEFLDGLDLRDALIRSRRFGSADALAMLVPVMDALAAAHLAGVLHRDVKPENIFLARGPDAEWIPKLIDFGISKMLGEDPSMRTRTRTGISVGTPDYMSPEQARGDSSVDARTDIWAVGAVLFELLAGRPPFDAPTANLVISRIITERAPPIESMVSALDADVCRLVNTALEPQRERRIASMAQFRDAAIACRCYPAELRGRRPTARKAVPLASLDEAVHTPTAPQAPVAAPLPPDAAVARAIKMAAPPPGVPLSAPIASQPFVPPRASRMPLVLTSALALTGFAMLMLVIALRHQAFSTVSQPTASVASNPPDTDASAAPTRISAQTANTLPSNTTAVAPVPIVATHEITPPASGRPAHMRSVLAPAHGHQSLSPIRHYSLH